MHNCPAVVRFFLHGVLIIILPFTTNPSFVTATELCPKLTEPENGEMDGSCIYSTSGKKCKFSCQEGFILVGKTPLTCLENLSWSDVQPHCRAEIRSFIPSRNQSKSIRWLFPPITLSHGSTAKVHCPDLTKPDHGDILGICENATSRNLCVFSCDKGYVLMGEKYLNCKEDLSWNFKKPHCRKECEKLDKLEHGKWNCSGSVATENDLFCDCICDPNYEPDGPINKYCPDGTWNTNDVTTCKKEPEKCTKPGNPVHGHVKCTVGNGKCNFTCDSGYWISGKTYIVCLDGKFDDKVPTCEKSKCTPPKEQPHLVPNCDSDEDMTCTFKCDKHYRLIGEEATFCINGKWNKDAPTCKSDTCRLPGKPDNGHMKCREELDKCVLICDDDYVVFGNRTIVCRDGEWVGTPTCTRTSRS